MEMDRVEFLGIRFILTIHWIYSQILYALTRCRMQIALICGNRVRLHYQENGFEISEHVLGSILSILISDQLWNFQFLYLILIIHHINLNIHCPYNLNLV